MSEAEEQECYFDKQTGVLMLVFRDDPEPGKTRTKFHFTRIVDADDLSEAITRLEQRVFPEEQQGGQN